MGSGHDGVRVTLTNKAAESMKVTIQRAVVGGAEATGELYSEGCNKMAYADLDPGETRVYEVALTPKPSTGAWRIEFEGLGCNTIVEGEALAPPAARDKHCRPVLSHVEALRQGHEPTTPVDFVRPAAVAGGGPETEIPTLRSTKSGPSGSNVGRLRV